MVPLGDWQQAAGRLAALAGDPVRQARLGERGRDFVQRYDYRVVAEEELAALRRVFGN
jgi:hypothetical protein